MARPSPGLRLLDAGRVPRVPWSAEYHDLPIGALPGLLVCLGVVGFALFALTELARQHLSPGAWVLLLAGLAAPVFIALWIARLLWAQLQAALRAGNWIARIAEEGLYLKLRSWLNWRLPGAADTAVCIPWSAIAGVHEVREEWRVMPRAGVRRGFNAFVVVTLAPDVDVAPLAAAVRAEVRRVITHPGFVKGVGAWSEVPVFVGVEGAIWVNRKDMSLLRALGARVPRGERVIQRLRIGPELPSDSAEVAPWQLVALVLRGQWSWACQLAQFRMGLGYDGAVALIERLFVPASAADDGTASTFNDGRGKAAHRHPGTRI